MSYTGYIVDVDLLTFFETHRDSYHETPILGDPTKSLVAVQWDNHNWQSEFESLAGVLPLGQQWETLPVEAASLLASFQPQGKLSIDIAVSEADTVSVALAKAHPQFARMLR